MRRGRPWRWPARVGLVIGLLVTGWIGLGWFVFGMRLPPLQWEPATLPFAGEAENFRVEADGATFLGEKDGVLQFFAFVPEPMFLVTCKEVTTAQFSVGNIHPEAIEEGFTSSEQRNLVREYALPISPDQGLMVRLKFPPREQYRFAALGDTGGEQELSTALDRAAALGADFLLHLGDLHYTDRGIFNAATHAARASIPMYTTIGNHDFHRGREHPVKDFQRLFGPRNSFFTLGGVSFLNLDTAADTYPASGGDRGKFVRNLWERAKPEDDWVVFTHRPLADPRVALGHIPPEKDHALHHQSEVDWLQDAYDHFGVDLVLNGHIHASYGTEVNGIPTWIVGNGMQLSETGPSGEPLILFGDWSPGGEGLQWHTEPLNAP